MIRKFIVIVTAYFIFELIIHGIIPAIHQDNEFDDFTIICHQIYDFFINASLLYVFRPRAFPEYFSLGIADVPLLGVRAFHDNEENEPRWQIAPLIRATLSKLMNKNDDQGYQFQSVDESNHSFSSNC
mmetsp:Transcript_25688/g.24974  ORF Transcript_25688/g.24974 Transcript_25688/m.24974 type:complete len:128 (-) Transcript_25688:233-616(-)